MHLFNSQRTFSADAMDSRKKASMDQYFREEDAKKIEQLVAKMEANQKEVAEMCSKDAEAHAALRRKEFSDLEDILSGHNIPKEVQYSLMHWKHGGRFVNEDWVYVA